MGVRPQRMANSTVQVRLQKLTAAQPQDETYGTKVLTVEDQYDAAISLRGQPRFGRNKGSNARMSGDSPETFGYVTFARDTLDAAGITDPDRLKNARIVGFERRAGIDGEDFIITRVDHRGHLAGGPILVKAYFSKHKDLVGSR